MLWRFSSSFALQLAGGALERMVGRGLVGLALGIALASWADCRLGILARLRVIHWLGGWARWRVPRCCTACTGRSRPSACAGALQRQEAQASDARLQEFLAALQASPNGVAA